MARTFDVVIIGAGAAGLFCGAEAQQRGGSVLVLDHASKPAEKVRISGGGRCNFTNLETTARRFISENPHFAKSALARYTPWDFCDLLARHGLSWHEKTLGQLFCDQKSGAVIKMLLDELARAGGELRLSSQVRAVHHTGDAFEIVTEQEILVCRSLVIATGGLSIPKIGASGFAYEIARKFGHAIVTPRPALVPLTFSGRLGERFAGLSGVSCLADVWVDGIMFHEALLFTHRGLSGPAVLQASSYWTPGNDIQIDFLPGQPAERVFLDAKVQTPRKTLASYLSEIFPRRLGLLFSEEMDIAMGAKLRELSDNHLTGVGRDLSSWTLRPTGTEGWRTAEVTVGGVSTDDLSSKTLESRHVPGLYFIGECVDVTGWLGGYNFQWAWASAHAAGAAIAARGTG